MNSVGTIIIISSLIYMIYLAWEFYDNKKNRKTFKHVIHVNGTRGKSSTCRLIDAALREEGYRVFSKTTGSSPRIIDVYGVEHQIIRKGAPNIKEQIKTLRKAAKQDTDIVVIECMAVKPELQYISQNRILDADISIVTNVRRDHLYEMGPKLEDVAKALGNVMPKDGYFITGEKGFIEYYKKIGEELNSQVYLAEEIEDDYGIDFKENISIVLELCNLLNISKESAIIGMKRYKKDPGTLKVYEITTGENYSVLFVNGLAINDPDSIMINYNFLRENGYFCDREFILLINNRRDRAYRVQQYVEVVERTRPDKIWITGDCKKLMKKSILRANLNNNSIFIIDDIESIGIEYLGKDTTIFAVGNIVDNGEKILEYIKKTGEEIV